MSRRRNARRGELAWKSLAGIMLVNGTLGVVAPRFLIRRLGVRPELEPGMIYVFRMFGVRTLFIAVDLFRRPQQRGRLLREGVAVHGIDTGAALTAAALGQLPWRHGLLVAGISFTNTVLAVVGARAYRGHP
ncbi:MAG TPA: hypothetical protein VKF16_00360 [Candidatus Dormibacteraeota bacterium]|nr:hypothetical protein [Candidatus Dormibacteraeota bacterium]